MINFYYRRWMEIIINIYTKRVLREGLWEALMQV